MCYGHASTWESQTWLCVVVVRVCGHAKEDQCIADSLRVTICDYAVHRRPRQQHSHHSIAIAITREFLHNIHTHCYYYTSLTASFRGQPGQAHTHLTSLCRGLPGWTSTRQVEPIWILLKQETVSGSGISWATCKSAPRSRQITTPAPHHLVFYSRMPFLLPN